MKLIRMLGVATLSAILVATSATGAVAGDDHGAPGAGFNATGDSSGAPGGTDFATAGDSSGSPTGGFIALGDGHGAPGSAGFTTTGEGSGSPGGTDFATTGDDHGSPTGGFTATSETKAADTPDGKPVGVLCDLHRYGSFNWNDYADDDHSKDIDNVTVYDQPGDGYSLKVKVFNKTNGRSKTVYAKYGGRISVDVGNVKNGDYVDVEAWPWEGKHQACAPKTTYRFWE
ncbi:hypothetical protein AB0B28_21410 [Glycomyces sp. NPDC046736]|uniref:hypothetical protein n=1 Tax=Glycomyces sp. NPDC046736 TaxID=3155615 RepID=UPI0033D80C37